jgi:hypothetical protein
MVARASPQSRRVAAVHGWERIVIAAHPPYSPDLASSDFEIGAIVIGSRRQFWVPQKVDFDQGFLEWMRRFGRYIEIGGDYAG